MPNPSARSDSNPNPAEFMAVPLLHYESDGKGPVNSGLRHPSVQPYGAYPTQAHDRKP